MSSKKKFHGPTSDCPRAIAALYEPWTSIALQIDPDRSKAMAAAHPSTNRRHRQWIVDHRKQSALAKTEIITP
jgi:hypothetical protein